MRSFSGLQYSKTMVREGDNRKEADTGLVRDQWSLILYEYSRRALTFEPDRLIALSGTAKMAKSVLKCEYYAGLWQYHLIRDLAWYTIDPGVRPNPYRAPTWSWASVQACELRYTIGRTVRTQRFGDGETEDFYRAIAARVVDVGCTAASSDPTGAVLDGFLKISSIALEVTLGYEAQAEDGHISCFVKLLGCNVDKLYLDVIEEDFLSHTYSCLVLGQPAYDRSLAMLLCRPKSPQDRRFDELGSLRLQATTKTSPTF